jgi:hypothetical protein
MIVVFICANERWRKFWIIISVNGANANNSDKQSGKGEDAAPLFRARPGE